MSICMSICTSNCMSICLIVITSVIMSVCISISISIGVSVSSGHRRRQSVCHLLPFSRTSLTRHPDGLRSTRNFANFVWPAVPACLVGCATAKKTYRDKSVIWFFFINFCLLCLFFQKSYSALYSTYRLNLFNTSLTRA